MTEHASIEELAAFAAGDLDAAARDRVTEHLAGCAECVGDVEALRRASTALAALPPVAIPVDVAAAIDAALEQERAGAPTTNVVPIARRRSTPWASGAVAASVIALVAGIGISVARQDDNGSRPTAADKGAVAAEAARETIRKETGQNYTRAALGTQVNDLLAPEALDSGAGTFAGSQTAPPGSAGGAAAPTVGRNSAKMAQLDRLRNDPAAFESCLQALRAELPAADRDVQPVAIDFGEFEGAPAVVILLPFRDTSLDVWVVGKDCTAADADLLYFARIRR